MAIGQQETEMFDPELESFKTAIDLRTYAASQGYALDRNESWRGSAVMRHPNGDKIIISRQPDGHYTYFSVRSNDDNGTIIDFVKHRTGLNLGGIRKALRAWTGTAAAALTDLPELGRTPKDRGAVQDRYASMRVAHRHPYLENERGIPALALEYWRFDGRVKIDRHNNAVFPHYDDQGLCGYELRNHGFKGFASGGTKGLWLSKTCPEDRRLVVCESAIDALSHAVLFPDGYARYSSIGGKPNPIQPGLIEAQIKRMPEGSEIVAAMDADDAGRELAKVVRRAFEASGRNDARFRIHMPSGKDWNDQLRGGQAPSLPARRLQEPNVA
jgi:hypothetical protein